MDFLFMGQTFRSREHFVTKPALKANLIGRQIVHADDVIGQILVATVLLRTMRTIEYLRPRIGILDAFRFLVTASLMLFYRTGTHRIRTPLAIDQLNFFQLFHKQIVVRLIDVGYTRAIGTQLLNG